MFFQLCTMNIKRDMVEKNNVKKKIEKRIINNKCVKIKKKNNVNNKLTINSH